MITVAVGVVAFIFGFVMGIVGHKQTTKQINGYLTITPKSDRDEWVIDIREDPEKVKYVLLEVVRRQL